ncbi:MAG: hypothetical protein Q4C96_08830 [Planctomycetia bacterium]|nr:hypothetical protein [Planctomycetia bacterium]
MSYVQNYRRKTSHSGKEISLFPFLAVLLCTMGAMIVLLLILARQTQQHGNISAKNTVAEVSPNMSDSEMAAREILSISPESLDVSEEISQEKQKLKMVFDEKQKKLEMEKGELIRLLNSQAEKNQELTGRQVLLNAMWEEMKNISAEIQKISSDLAQKKNSGSVTSQAELKFKILEKELELEKLQEKIRVAESNARQEDGSYVVVPYVGPGGTRRYPLYAECRADGVYLMPENIRLSENDFQGMVSRSNPLQAAMSVKREYLRKTEAFYETAEGVQDPYPLLIVRPDGILYLYMAREALQSWWTEFGYELVSSNIKIEYPPVDEALKHMMEQAIFQAREFQVELAETSPAISHLAGGRYSQAGGVMAFHPTSQGTNVLNIEPGSRLEKTLRNSQRRGYAASDWPVNPDGTSLLGNGNEIRSTTVFPDEAAQDTGIFPNVAQKSSGDFSGTESSMGDPDILSSNLNENNSIKMNLPSQEMVSENASTPGESDVLGNSSPSSKGSCSSSGDHSSSDLPKQANWALEDYHPSRSPLIRPIRVECYPDRMVVTKTSDMPEVTIPFTTTYSTTKKLVAEVGSRVSSWGNPGPGMYWRPLLRVHVAEDAREIFRDLNLMLNNSGLKIEEI